MDASCGPSNALTNLSKYSQRDNSLQHQNNRPGQQQNQFRNVAVDQNLNQEFNAFSGNQFAQFTPQVPMHQQSAQPQMHSNQNMQQHGGQKWVNDFSNMSLQNNDWQHQFMQQAPRHMQQQHQSQHTAQYAGQHMTQMRPMGMNMGMAHMNQLNSMNGPVSANMTEHQEVHKIEDQHKQFEDQFAQIEQEMQGNEAEKEEFAKTAQKIHDSMLTSTKEEATSEKFQNSNFLKLMGSISNRSVELNAEGDKLVDKESGQDIRERELADIKQHLPDPLKDAREQTPNYHQPEHEATSFGLSPSTHFDRIPQPQQPTPDQINRLPDPLAHIADGALADISEPLQAAKVISGGQVQNNNWLEDPDDWLPPKQRQRPNIFANSAWQEIYDDYRHDDDFR